MYRGEKSRKRQGKLDESESINVQTLHCFVVGEISLKKCGGGDYLSRKVCRFALGSTGLTGQHCAHSASEQFLWHFKY